MAGQEKGSRAQTEHNVQSKHLVEKQKTETKDIKRKKLWPVVKKATSYPKMSRFPGNCEIGKRLVNGRSSSQQLYQ